MRWLMVLFPACLALTAEAQLQWDKRELEFKSSATDTNVVAKFAFHNDGKKPVTIRSVKSTCGCTSLVGDKKIYLPGEKGEVAANLVFGQRVGLQEKKIIVQTDDPSKPQVDLLFKVHIPELIKITPSIIYWKKGETRAPKNITLKVVHNEPIRMLNVQSSGGTFVSQLKTLKEGAEYSLEVTPVSTGSAVMTVMRIETDYPKARPRIFNVYAMVKAGR